MKEAIGGISLFQIVIVFLLVFTGVMCLTINHSKAFGVKDEIINILENDVISSGGGVQNYEISSTTLSNIVAHLNDVGYRITGKCPSGSWVGYDRNETPNNDNAAFCIRAVNVGNEYYNDIVDKCSNGKCDPSTGDYPSMVYYDVIVFYQLDIPIIKRIFNLKLHGSTKVLFG